MANPTHPIYTFEVVAYNASEIFATPLPDSRDNILFGLENRTTWFNTISEPLKHGDQFTVSGQQAYYLKKCYVDVTNPSLKIVTIIPTVTTDEAEFSYHTSVDLAGTIVSGSSITSYGFVWAEHPTPTLEDNVEVVGTSSYNGSFALTINGLPYPATIYVRAYATNSSGTGYGAILSGETEICLALGTQINTLYGYKNIEDIDYEDELMVWDFDKGQFHYSKPIWMVRPFTSSWQAVVTFDNGTKLTTVNDGKGHRIYNVERGEFTHMMSDDTPIGTTTFDEDGNLLKVVKKEVSKEKTTYCNIITDKHLNVFANGILTSTGLNNLYPIKNMKFQKDNRQFSNNDFSIPDDLFEGLRIAEHVNYPNLDRKLKQMASRQLTDLAGSRSV